MTRAIRRSFQRVLRPLCTKAIVLALNFVREHTPESCTRLCAVLCCLAGCWSAFATQSFAAANPAVPATVAALVGQTSALIAAGCVALLTRTRQGAPAEGAP
jgi:hypothetical protein